MSKTSRPAWAIAAILAAGLLLPASASALAVGDEAPDFGLRDLRSGDTVRLSDLRGRHVLIDFWATWCAPCRRSMQEELAPLWRGRSDGETRWTLVSIGTNWSGDTAAQQRRFAREAEYGWTFVHDPDGDVTRDFDVEGIPTLYLVDSEGRIVGRDDTALAQLRELLDPRPSLADRATDMNGDSASGRVTEGQDEVVFRLTVDAPSEVVLETEAEFDTYLRLRDARGRLLMENDDIASGNTLSRVTYQARAGEELFAVVSGYGGATGAFTLHRRTREPLAKRAREFVGERVEGTIRDAEDQEFFVLRITEPGEIVLETEGDFDTELELRDAQGIRVAYNDDAGSGTLSAIVHEVEAGDVLFVVVGGYGDATGDFALVRRERAPLHERAIDFVGDRMEGEVTGIAGAVAYRLEIEDEGEMVLQTEGDFDTLLRLLDMEGEELEVNDDIASGNTLSRIVRFVKPGDEFLVVVEGYGGDTGEFALTFRMRPPLDERAIDFAGHRVVGEIRESGDEVVYRVVAERDGELTLHTKGEMDTVLRLLDAEGTLLAENDDTAETGTLARLTRDVAKGDELFVVVANYASRPGEFVLIKGYRPRLVDRATPVSAGGEVGGQLERRGEAVYRFRAPEAGTWVVETWGETDTLIRVHDGEGQDLGENDDKSVEDLGSRLELPLDEGQQVFIVVSAFLGEPGSFMLEIHSAD